MESIFVHYSVYLLKKKKKKKKREKKNLYIIQWGWGGKDPQWNFHTSP